jgi:hypothetical protein
MSSVVSYNPFARAISSHDMTNSSPEFVVIQLSRMITIGDKVKKRFLKEYVHGRVTQ